MFLNKYATKVSSCACLVLNADRFDARNVFISMQRVDITILFVIDFVRLPLDFNKHTLRKIIRKIVRRCDATAVY